jgi:transmembrane serine protease 9
MRNSFLVACLTISVCISESKAQAPSPESVSPKFERRLGPAALYASITSKTARADEIPVVLQDVLTGILGNPRILAVDPRVVGGSPAPIGAYPWQVSIGISGAPHDVSHFCGGSLIAPQWILTAAHCVSGGTTPDNIDVLTGTNFLSKGGRTGLIDRIIVHEKWDPDTFDHDVALLHLKGASGERPIGLITPSDASLASPGLIAIVSGWGLTREIEAKPSNVLRNVTVQLVTKKDCTSPAAYGEAITDTMICAGFAEGGKDSCQGDSGGPLIVPDKKGSFLLAGIVSWGEGCGRPSKYGVYTSIPTIQKWVVANIKTR